MSRSVVVLWIERAVDGTASRAHLNGTVARLRTAEIDPETVIFNEVDGDGSEGVFRKVTRISRLVLRGLISAGPEKTLFARFHPALLPIQMVWRARGGRVVVSVQGSLEDMRADGNSRLARLPGLRSVSVGVLRMADRLVIGNPTLVEHVRQVSSRDDMVVIPNGVFVDSMRGVAGVGRPLERPYAVYVGNFADWQGIETLVLATQSTEWPEDLPLVVVGDGTERGLVEAGIGSNLIWVGKQPSEVARQWLAHAEFAFSLKRSDTPTAKHGYWPFKMLESAAVGVPIIVSDAEGMADAARKLGNAVVVPCQDAQAAAEAAATLHASPGLRSRLAMTGLEGIREYDWVAGSSQLSTLL